MVIKISQREKIEIVIGISSTIDFYKNRIIGFANIFDYNGNYLIGDCSYLSTQEDYLENLKNYLAEVIKRVIEIKGIEKDEKFRLIFHLTKELCIFLSLQRRGQPAQKIPLFKGGGR